MASNKMRMPSSSAGLTSFYAEYKSKLVLKAEHVIALIVIVIILMIILHSTV
jgi:preprotein translocase subunit Sec61beta